MQMFTGKQYLQIDIANNFGLDKKTWNERLAWFEANEGNLLELLPKADKPALFYAGVRAYEAVLRGEPIGYPISLDATSSALQLLQGGAIASRACRIVGLERLPLRSGEPLGKCEGRLGFTPGSA